MRRPAVLLSPLVLPLIAAIAAPGPVSAPVAPVPTTLQQSPAHELLLAPDNPAWAVDAPDLFRVRFDTTQGTFLLEVHRRWAPLGADRLYNLVRLGFYDDTRVYRVRAGFIAQFGLSGDPTVNAVWYDRTMPDDPVRRSNGRGMVSYAMLPEPGTRTTQLFINLEDNARLDEQGFAPLARVVEGMDVVDALYSIYDEGAGGGMRGGNQGEIVAGGNAHLDAEFPLLDQIVRAHIEAASIMRFPDVGGNRIRTELHLLPAVTTGPLDPTYSPDGSWIAFSMRGDIWKVPAGGGEAVALTRGPAYHFEPTWSPDGMQLALSVELDGNFDIGVVDASGGEVRRLTRHPHVDVQPSWSADSQRVYFASARARGFDIYSIDVHGGEPVRVLAGPGHQIQPHVSPDGTHLAFVSPLRGRLGTGAIWSAELPPLAAATEGSADDRLIDATLVHYEETSFRTKPTWSANGRSIVFISDAAGSNDVAVVPAAGGAIARLTEDSGDEFTPAISPDGKHLAFVSNREGATHLYTAPAGGSRRGGWKQVRVSSRRAAQPTGRVHIQVRDAETGELLAARIYLTASDSRAYAPDGGFHKVISPTDTHYFHSTDRQAVEVEVPVGPVRLEAMHGFEFAPATTTVQVTAGVTTTALLELRRVVDMAAEGWYSGETHAHDLHQGRFGLSRQDFFDQLVAEDLGATNALIHMDGTHIMGRWDDLTGEPSPLSTPTHVLQYAQEFRGSFGHVALLGISEFVMPLIGGTPDTAFAADVLNADYLQAARDQGGIGGFTHPYTRPVVTAADGASQEVALDVALGMSEYYDVGSIWYDELDNAAMYARFLNTGFRLAATGGSDNFSDVWREPPPGTTRTYARLEEPLTMHAWLDAVKAGRTFVTTGPLVQLQVNGARPGDELALAAHDATSSGADQQLRVAIEVASIVPLERVELVANGRVVYSMDARGSGGRFRIETTLPLPAGGWVSARAVGPPSRQVTDSYAFAQTSPVWVVRGGKPYRNAEDARFLAEMVRGLWERVARRDRFASSAARKRYEAAAQEAIRVYEQIAAQADQNGSLSR